MSGTKIVLVSFVMLCVMQSAIANPELPTWQSKYLRESPTDKKIAFRDWCVSIGFLEPERKVKLTVIQQLIKDEYVEHMEPNRSVYAICETL